MERTLLLLLRDGLKKCFSKQLLKYKGSRIRVSAPDWCSFCVCRPHGYRAMRSEQSEERKKERRKKEDKMGNFNGLSTRCADDSKVRQGYQ